MTTYEELMQIIKSRRSVRSFKDEPVNRDDVGRLVEAARWAPSNHNHQDWKFLAYDDRDFIWKVAAEVGVAVRHRIAGIAKPHPEQVAEMVGQATLFAKAPCLIVVLHKQPAATAGGILAGVANPELVSGEPLSSAMAVQNLLLAARALNLGACVMTAPLAVREVLDHLPGRPPGYDVTCLVALGHPADFPPAPERKGIEHILQFGDKS
jgi:nitroreductase